MNIALLYFSGTGNTEWLAWTLSDKLINCGSEVDLFDLGKECMFNHHDYDTFILAHPVYGANAPRIVIEKTTALIPGNRRLNIVATYGYVNALGYFAEKKVLGRKIDSYYNVRMFNNISTPRSALHIPPLSRRQKKMKKLEERISRIADRLSRGRRRIMGIGPQLFGGIFVRKALTESIQKNYLTFGVDPARCTLCRLCIKECPTHSIEEKDGKFTFHATCTACMRCYNRCPEYAVTIDGEYADPDVYTRYHGPWK